MSTKATDLINIEKCLEDNNLMGAINVWNETYSIITPNEFFSCCRNTGEFSSVEELVESINGIIISCNYALEAIKKTTNLNMNDQ